MNKEESLSFLQSCIDKVNLATTQDIQFYREMYNKNCAIEEQESSSSAISRKARWIEVDTNRYTCSNCSHCFTIVPEDNRIWQFKYCPNCKTEMESENKKNCNNCTHHTDADEIHGITPCGSCDVDLKNFKQKTESER